jgi:ADP-dependent NAD(P)H-hydrate dehydratase / NAD(P)H-hydrate epimerase
MTVQVVTSAQAAARDRAVIDGGVPPRALMQRAGAAAAAEIVRHFGDRLTRGVAVFAGPGNNGGDAWVVAAALAAVGVSVRVVEVGDAKTGDCRAEREHARSNYNFSTPSGAEEVVIDGILGTGASGAPRGAAADGIQRIAALRANGASIVALDLPSGLDATTGDENESVRADLTITFGTIKRGALVRRHRCGHIAVVDIGLGRAPDDGALTLLDRTWVHERVPEIRARAHKGTRRRIAMVGGTRGMAGAAILATRAALRSGVGMVRAIVHSESIGPIQMAAPAALTTEWLQSDDEIRDVICDWAHAVVIGPGLGRAPDTRARVEQLLRVWLGPVLIDADALNVFEGDAASLGALIGKRTAIITPHPVEFSRLTGMSTDDVVHNAFDAGRDLANTLGAIVLLKGVPTVITGPKGKSFVSSSGTPVLATGGSGDALAGIAGTLMAQMQDPLEAAACAAWIHGRAGELAGVRGVRGATIEDVIDALDDVWIEPLPAPRPPVLAELPALDARARGDR